MMHITGIYAALAALIVVTLGLRVSLARGASGIGIGDGGNRVLERRIRVHANAAENVPLALVLLLLLELDQTQTWLLHAFGVTLIAARVLHAIGLSRSSRTTVERFSGTFLTWTTIGVMALVLLWQSFGARVIAGAA